ncbi:hypothetical protein BFP72_01860 [Reichenbachiella sp. 5M10]|nr:hypothetical protein BFP72_01860 [Reichenbachiella sp. 5M10]
MVVVMGWCVVATAQTPQIWIDYQEDRAQGVIPELTDYSYAGYHFSEKEIPDVSDWTYFDVTDYGAVADDELYDDAAIQQAIDAAQASDGPAVVFFPVGKFIVSEDHDTNKKILVSRDSIVLKGSGSAEGGTEIFMDQSRVQNGHWQFLFETNTSAVSGNTFITEPVPEGAHSVIVEDASGFVVGEVVLISHKSTAFAEAHFGELELDESWTRLFGYGGGMSLYELHEISEINGSKITFKNPVQTGLPLLSSKYTVAHYSLIEEVGVEDILFTSDWENYPEDFYHHKDDIHDYAWNAVQFSHVRNAWLRNCEFRHWNQVMDVRESIGVTVENVVLSGKKGHASFLTRRGYGLLVKDCDDQVGQHHGPGTGYSGVNTVYLRHKMLTDQSIDSHSGQPYATLMDDVDGGVMDKNGGPYESYPHHGQDFTFWNYVHKASGPKTYDYWNATNRNGNTYAHPHFIGFQANDVVNQIDMGIHQMEGQRVSPASLFEAQLALRQADEASKPTIAWLSPAYGGQLEIGDDLQVKVAVADPDGTVDEVIFYFDGVIQREINAAPYNWGEEEVLDPVLFDLPGGTYPLKIKATDNDGNVAVDSILIYVGQAPTVAFEQPLDEVVHQSGTPLIVEAIASDEDGTIASVTLTLDGQEVSTLIEPPYRWEGLSELDALVSGTYVLTLEAIDNDQLSTTIEHTLLVNDFPQLSITSPTANQHFAVGSDVQVDAVATDADGSIVEVLLYLNEDLQRKETSVPYSWGERSDLDPDLFGMDPGAYTIRVTAIDDLGSESTSMLSIVIEEVLEVEPELQVMVYPNPFGDHLSIESVAPISRISLVNLMGQERRLSSYPEGQYLASVETSQLPQGIYLLRIWTHSADFQIVKLIKQ